jgi:hypothetical protein
MSETLPLATVGVNRISMLETMREFESSAYEIIPALIARVEELEKLADDCAADSRRNFNAACQNALALAQLRKETK